MKHLFLSMAAVAMLASCSSDEIIDKAPAQKSAIGFSTFVDKSTRATDIETNTISDFKVWGYMNGSDGVVFDGTTVTKQSNDEWKSDEDGFWSANKKYDFSAIAPAKITDENASFDYTVNDADASKGKITFANGNGITDLLYAYNGDKQTGETITDDPGKVDLTFKHLLSRVKFKFINGIKNANSNLEISEVTITNAVTKATIEVNGASHGGTWEGENFGHLSFGGTTVEGNIFGTACGETEHYYMIPVLSSTPSTSTPYTYTVTFKVKWKQHNEYMNAEPYTHMVTIPEVNMTSGNSYVFSTTLDATNINPGDNDNNPNTPNFYPITFTVTEVSGWDGDNSYDETVFPGN